MKLQPLVIEGPHGKLVLGPRFVAVPRQVNPPCRFIEVFAQCGAFQGDKSCYPLEEDFQSFCSDLAALSLNGTGAARLSCGANDELLIVVSSSDVEGVFTVQAQILQDIEIHGSLTRPFRQEARISFWVERAALAKAIAASWLAGPGS